VSPDAKRNVIIAGALVAVSVWYFGAQARRQRAEDDKAPGEIRAAVAVGDAFVVHEVLDRRVDNEKVYGFRLSVEVPGGGDRARVILDEARACGPASPGKIWCVYKLREEHLELRDANTLAVVADDGRLRVAMGSGLAAPTPQIDLATGELRVYTLAGAYLVLDATGPRARPAPEGVPPVRTLALDHDRPRSLSKSGEEYRYEGFMK
jgi:hypothetical protein